MCENKSIINENLLDELQELNMQIGLIQDFMEIHDGHDIFLGTPKSQIKISDEHWRKATLSNLLTLQAKRGLITTIPDFNMSNTCDSDSCCGKDDGSCS